MFRKFNTNTVTWRDQVKFLTEANKEFMANASRMSLYEQDLVKNEIKERRNLWGPGIVQGCLDEYEQKINRYKAARETNRREKAAEVVSWDPTRLNAELQSIKTLAELAIKQGDDPLSKDPKTAARLAEIYKQHATSGDRYKARAAAEVMQGVLDSVPEPERLATNNLVKQAARDLKTLRSNESIIRAEQNEAAALDEMIAHQDQIDRASEAINGYPADRIFANSPLDRALRRITVGTGGEIKINDPDSSEVTGVYFVGTTETYTSE